VPSQNYRSAIASADSFDRYYRLSVFCTIALTLMVTGPRHNSCTVHDDADIAAVGGDGARIRHKHSTVHHQCFNDLRHLVTATHVTAEKATNTSRYGILRQRQQIPSYTRIHTHRFNGHLRAANNFYKLERCNTWPVATCRQSPYLNKPATVTVTSFSL